MILDMAKFKLFAEYRGLRKELYILFIGRMMTNLGSMIWPIFTLILNQKLGMDAQTIAIAMMIYAAVSIPVSIIGGIITDKVNKKYIIVVCDLISVASFIYCFFAPITIPTIIIFAAASLFQNIEWPAYDALIADFTTSKDRERAYSLSYLGANLGLVLAPTLGGLLFNNYLNLAFLINGIAIFTSTVLIFFLIRNVSKEKDNSKASEYEQEIEHKSNPLVYIIKNKVILLYFFIGIIGNFTYAMYNYLMPLDLAAAYPENGSVIFGTMSSVNCIVVVLFTALITRIFRKVFDLDKFYIGEGLKLLGFAIFFIFIRTTFLCYVAIVVFTYGEIFNTLASSPFMTRRIPASHRGRIIAILNVTLSLTVSLMEWGIGVVYDNPKMGSVWAWSIVLGTGILTGTLLTITRILDRKHYPGLHYCHIFENGSVLELRYSKKKYLNEYYKQFVMDDSIYEDPYTMPVYEYSEEKVNAYWNKIRMEKNRENFVLFLDKDPIGEVSLKHITNGNECDLSIHLKNDNYKNRGYGYIAEKMAIDYAFYRLNLKVVKADCILKNERSRHVLEKVGFQEVSRDEKFVYYQILRDQEA